MTSNPTFTLTLDDSRDRMLVDLTLYEVLIKRALELQRHHPSNDADRMDDTIKECEMKLTQIQAVRLQLLDIFYNSY